MNRTSRVLKLGSLVDTCGGTLASRKKFHKIVYLLQEAGEDFDQDFIFHNYGPYSPTLVSDISYATDEQVAVLLEKRDVPLGFYIYRLGSGFAATSDASDAISEPAKSMIKEFAGKEPRLLEVLSTIVYLHRNHYDGQRLLDKLHELKPNHKKHFDEAASLARELYDIAV